jgi:uncharacterized secreted protein with C-terminal beta-propeller domain
MHTQRFQSSLKYSLIAVSIALASCGGGGTDSSTTPTPTPTPNPIDEPVATGLLIPIETQEQLVQSFRQGFDGIIDPTAQVNMADDAPLAETTSVDSASSRSFTTTYTLEKSVDEHDAVKYDGSHLFIAPSRSMNCCFIVDDFILEGDVMIANDALMVPEEGMTESDEHSIRILATDPEQAGASQVGSIAIDSNRSVEGLYIDDSQLVSINSSGWWGLYGDAFISPRTWQGQSTGLAVYDISDTANPTLDWQIDIEGGFISSRKKGDIVYLVARHTPRAEGLHYYPTDDEMLTENQATLDALSIEDILPKISINGTESSLLGATDCSIADAEHSSSPTASYTPTMTLLIAIDLASGDNSEPAVAQTVCYMEPTSGIYVSENAIYLTQADYNNSEPRTFVHKYGLGEEISYVGSGVVDGTISGSSSDFRINEHAGYLRLVTTEFTDDSADRFDHQVFVLKQSETQAELEVVATLPNQQRADEIGKPNEDLYGVRFLGDTLYLVTFERTDPLYVVDLSNAMDPMIAGELSVPGFSDFLHPVNSELLLGLGQDENSAVKLELFNVSSIESPYSLGTVVLAPEASWSRSEARYNHHAFTYQPISESTDRFSIPLSLGLYDGEGGYREEDRLYLFEIDSKDTSELSSIVEVGHISAKSQWWNSLQRSVFDGDAVYFINGSSVWSTLWSNPTEQNGPL